MTDDVTFREMSTGEAAAHIDDLVEIIRDSVANGSSVNFLADVTPAQLREFWSSSIAEQRNGGRLLFVAECDGHVVATTMLLLAPQPNQSHRAEIAKMLVHSSYRRRGIARQLLHMAESAALERGRTLLMLDTEKDSAGEALYVATGWHRFGEVPGHAMKPDGTPSPTSFFYKIIGP